MCSDAVYKPLIRRHGSWNWNHLHEFVYCLNLFCLHVSLQGGKWNEKLLYFPGWSRASFWRKHATQNNSEHTSILLEIQMQQPVQRIPWGLPDFTITGFQKYMMQKPQKSLTPCGDKVSNFSVAFASFIFLETGDCEVANRFIPFLEKSHQFKSGNPSETFNWYHFMWSGSLGGCDGEFDPESGLQLSGPKLRTSLDDRVGSSLRRPKMLTSWDDWSTLQKGGGSINVKNDW